MQSKYFKMWTKYRASVQRAKKSCDFFCILSSNMHNWSEFYGHRPPDSALLTSTGWALAVCTRENQLCRTFSDDTQRSHFDNGDRQYWLGSAVLVAHG